MANLLVIEGNNKGERFVLESEQTFIGRESKNEISFNNASISRRHCVVEKRDQSFFVKDLESLNGTLVNGLKITETLLKNGDSIQVGDFTFRFFENGGTDAPISSLINFAEDKLDLSKTINLRFEEAVGSMARDLVALMQFSTRINVINGLENLQYEILQQLFEVIPAQSGAILLIDADGDFEKVFGINRSGKNESVNISRTIVGQVLQEKIAVLANNVASDEILGQAESLFLSMTSSLLCVPLVLLEKTLGVVYLATDQTRARFDEGHLRFLMAITGISAVAIENARNFEMLQSENARLREETLLEQNMLGESEVMKKIFVLIGKVAPTDSTVLIDGESGTGKELAARAIHLNSRRKENPFVAINCAALTETLLESELFGHERGAFTGAVAQKKGKIELAQGGTLFLDEIGEIAPGLQAKLLRVLQEREFERVGGLKPIKADIRLVAATNRDLEAEAKAGNFRQDLFYRLNVVRLTMPALRERRDDILLLAESFMHKFACQMNRRLRGISAKAKKLLLAYDFPGNVRELENAVERAVVLGAGEWILPEDLPENFWDGLSLTADSTLNYHDAVQEKKKELIRRALSEAKGSYVEAAKLLDVHPNYLHRLIRNLNIKDELEG
jgi:transcriptional regulator with GAF, ATPase, and Fis domain